tara:strand:+ start:61 stop:495 length:435 start_codon:yes stop_codon:yes gene_type:complete
LNNGGNINGIEMWKETGIIHCLIERNFNFKSLGLEMFELLSKRTKTLYKGRNLPLISHLAKVNHLQAFHFFSPCSPFNLKVRMSVFFVNSYMLKTKMMLFCVLDGNAFWNTTYDNKVRTLEQFKTRLKMSFLMKKRLEYGKNFC